MSDAIRRLARRILIPPHLRGSILGLRIAAMYTRANGDERSGAQRESSHRTREGGIDDRWRDAFAG